MELHSSEVDTLLTFFNLTLEGGFNFFRFTNPYYPDATRKYRFVSPPSIASSTAMTAIASMSWEEVWDVA